MAAPTTFRVEAISQTQTILRWHYTGSNSIGIYRSPDGITYALVDSVAATVKIFNDELLTAGTKYWYKLSDDVGATFSSVKTVVTHVCGDTNSGKRVGFHLPRFSEGELLEKGAHQKLGKAMRSIEDVIQKNVFNQDPCVVCVVDGAITINCADGCDCYDVDATTDINSISFINCDGIDPCIHFKVPPNTTIGICGFPQGHQGDSSQYSGDECTSAPINGGTHGRTVTTGKPPPKSKPGSGKGGGTSRGCTDPLGCPDGECECVAGKSGQLVVKCCSKNCSMACGSTNSLDIRICGGTGPYTIAGSSGLQFKKSNGVAVGSGTIGPGEVISITPPANSGSGVAGNAYTQWWYDCTGCLAGVCISKNHFYHNDYSCNDVKNPTCFVTADGHTHCAGSDPSLSSMTCGTSVVNSCLPVCTGTCQDGRFGVTCDDRTAGMIAANCNPCGTSTNGKTVTVTDAQGVSFVSILTS